MSSRRVASHCVALRLSRPLCERDKIMSTRWEIVDTIFILACIYISRYRSATDRALYSRCCVIFTRKRDDNNVHAIRSVNNGWPLTPPRRAPSTLEAIKMLFSQTKCTNWIFYLALLNVRCSRSRVYLCTSLNFEWLYTREKKTRTYAEKETERMHINIHSKRIRRTKRFVSFDRLHRSSHRFMTNTLILILANTSMI